MKPARVAAWSLAALALAGARMKRARIAAWSVAALVLAAVFAAYQRPDLAVDLANRIWACF